MNVTKCIIILIVALYYIMAISIIIGDCEGHVVIDKRMGFAMLVVPSAFYQTWKMTHKKR